MPWSFFRTLYKRKSGTLSLRADDPTKGTAHLPLAQRYTRYFASELRTGEPAAHTEYCLMLLGSPPDMVHSALPHRIRHPHADMHE